MTLIEWKSEFGTGIPALDHEHRELIGLLNQVYDRLKPAGGTCAVEAFLGEVHAQISAHFALEEAIMRRERYKDYRPHKEDHERLLDEIRDIMDDCEGEASADIGAALAPRLERWFVQHFRTHDARLHRILGI